MPRRTLNRAIHALLTAAVIAAAGSYAYTAWPEDGADLPFACIQDHPGHVSSRACYEAMMAGVQPEAVAVSSKLNRAANGEAVEWPAD